MHVAATAAQEFEFARPVSVQATASPSIRHVVTLGALSAETMLKAKVKKLGRRITVGEDKAYDTAAHVTNLRAINVTPHVAQNDSITSTGKRRSAIDGRTTRHQGYEMSQSCRTMTECIFGWGKEHGTMRKTKHRGIAAVAADFLLTSFGTREAAPVCTENSDSAILVTKTAKNRS
jgi:hypothetical protein